MSWTVSYNGPIDGAATALDDAFTAELARYAGGAEGSPQAVEFDSISDAQNLVSAAVAATAAGATVSVSAGGSAVYAGSGFLGCDVSVKYGIGNTGGSSG